MGNDNVNFQHFEIPYDKRYDQIMEWPQEELKARHSQSVNITTVLNKVFLMAKQASPLANFKLDIYARQIKLLSIGNHDHEMPMFSIWKAWINI